MSAACTTCGRPVGAPFRRYTGEGKAYRVAEGCVDAAHNGHLAEGTLSHAWHVRPAARLIRNGWATMRGSLCPRASDSEPEAPRDDPWRSAHHCDGCGVRLEPAGAPTHSPSCDVWPSRGAE